MSEREPEVRWGGERGAQKGTESRVGMYLGSAAKNVQLQAAARPAPNA